MKREDQDFIRAAAAFFEVPSALNRTLSSLGNAVEGGFARLPEAVKRSTLKASRRAIEGCLMLAVKTIAPSSHKGIEVSEVAEKNRVRRNSHTMAAGFAGGVGGLLGPASLAVELPISTALIMRTIAATADDFGFDLKDPEVLLECLFVFAIGGPSSADDGMDSTYIASRLAMTSLLRNAAATMTGLPTKQLLTVLEKETAPAVVRVVTAISEAFGVRVSQKFIAQLAPVVGAVGGASINLAFANFFGSAAKYHFGMKRLELEHGSEIVQKAYADEAARLRAQSA